MPFMPWTDTYSVGVRTIDDQHKHLVSLINGLHEVMSSGSARDHLDAVLQDLLSYTDFHFAAEEQLMQRAAYPGFPVHQQKHRAMRAEVEKLAAANAGGGAIVSIKLMNFLKDWLGKHICQTDREYVPSMKAAGID